MRIQPMIAIAVLALVTWACESSSERSVRPQSATTGAISGIESTKKPPTAPKPTAQPEYTLALGQVEDPARVSEFVTLEPNHKLVAVEFIITNINGKPIDVNPLHGTMVDKEGYSYRCTLAARAGSQLDVVTLNRGEKVKGWIAFQTLPEARVNYIKYDLEPFGSLTIQSPRLE